MKSLPANLDAERATLGSCLLNREAIIAVSAWLEPDAFYLEQHAWIYEAIQACYRQRTPPDIRTVSEELRRRERLDAVGGLLTLSALVDSVPTSYHIEYYARIVERTALMRKLIGAGGKIAALGYDEQDDPDTAIARAMTTLLEVARRSSTQTLTSVKTVMDRLYALLGSDREPGLYAGFRDYDRMTGGFHAGDLILLGARPGNGKTSLAMNIARNVAREKPVIIFSLEMSDESLGQRLLAMEAKVDLGHIRNEMLNEERMRSLMLAMSDIAMLQMHFDACGHQTIGSLRAQAMRAAAQHGELGLIVVDYIQLIASEQRSESRNVDVSSISRGLKALAMDLRCPVLALSQLSREVEKRASHIPILADLRDSGSLEQDADQVLFIYREELYDPESDKKGMAELHLAKHRNGPTGVTLLRFDAATTSFHDLTYRTPEGY